MQTQRHQDHYVWARQHRSGVFGDDMGMAFLAVGALLGTDDDGTPLYPGPRGDYEVAVAAYRKSTAGEEMTQRVQDAKQAANADADAFTLRYVEKARRQQDALNDHPFLSNELLVEALPEAVRNRVTNDLSSDSDWAEVHARAFAANWLNRSEVGATAAAVLIWMGDHPDVITEAESAVVSSELLQPIVLIGRTEEPDSREGRAEARRVKKASKASVKAQGLTRKRLRNLEEGARIWAAVQVSGERPTQLVENDWFIQRFQHIATARLSSLLRPFDRALGIVRPTGRPHSTDDYLGPELHGYRNDPTRH